jgi:hypothetical protein
VLIAVCQEFNTPSSNSSALSIRFPDEEQGDENSETVDQYGTKVGEISSSSKRDTL